MGEGVRAARLRQPLRVEIAPGELLDKITILQIKRERIADPAKRANVAAELAMLQEVRAHVLVEPAELDPVVAELQAVNQRLWDVEDALRQCERAGEFGDRFIALARSVYQLNDRRALLKRRLNEWFDSPLVEEKSYTSSPEGESPLEDAERPPSP